SQKLTSSIPRGQGPDVFIYAHETVGKWSESDLIAPIGQQGDDLQLDRFVPVTAEALQYDSRVWGYPLAFKSVALIYNRSLIDEPPKTTDELVRLVERHTDPASDSYGLAYRADSFYFHAPWLFGFGGGVFTEAGQVRLDRPANARSFRFVADLRQRNLIPPEPTGALISKLFNDGRAAMVIQGPWFLGNIDESVDYGVAPLPVVSGTGERATPFLTVEAAMVSAETEHPELAREFARDLAGEASARTRLSVGRQLVALQSVYDERADELSPALQAFRLQADHARPMPNDPRMGAVWEPASRALRSVLRGDTDAEVALAEAQSDYETVTRPPPDEKQPTPYLIALGLLLL
ncbi:MAG: extracellular solute-binding protein, partial [Bradymonadaceae bacterium]